jgi:regulator of sirC expression with transglutaminase-like and TPR domain
MVKKSEITSLIFLLDDPDPFVQEQVRDRLRQLGDRAVPLLDEHKSEVKDQAEREKINGIIHSITYGNLEQDFVDFLDNGIKTPERLEDAMLLLARFGNPTLRAGEYKKKLDHFADMVHDDIRYSMSERKQMRRLLRFVFDDLNFRGDTEDYHDPANSYLNDVIDQRKGLPISLSLIVMFLARRLDLPFYGINMPIHFMLKFNGDQQSVFIDPFDGGKVVTYDQCYYFLKKNGIEPKADHFKPARPIDILSRSIRNLMHGYAKREELERVSQLKDLLNTVEMYSTV